MPDIVKAWTFRAWVENNYPHIYDENKTDYQLISDLKDYYWDIQARFATDYNILLELNRIKSSAFVSFNDWYNLNVDEHSSMLVTNLDNATKNGTITNLKAVFEALDSIMFKSIL